MIGRGTPSYFGSLFNPEDEVFSRSVLGARQGLTGQAGQITSFANAQKAQQDQMASLVQLAQQQAAQQSQQLQQSANTAQTAAERARQDAIAEQNAKLSKQQWQAEFDARTAATNEELALRRQQEQRQQYLNTPQPIYADYSAAFGGIPITSQLRGMFGSDTTSPQYMQELNRRYADMAGRPGSNIYVTGYAKPQQ